MKRTKKEIAAIQKELIFKLKHMINDVDAEYANRPLGSQEGQYRLSLDNLRLLLWECIQEFSQTSQTRLR